MRCLSFLILSFSVFILNSCSNEVLYRSPANLFPPDKPDVEPSGPAPSLSKIEVDDACHLFITESYKLFKLSCSSEKVKKVVFKDNNDDEIEPQSVLAVYDINSYFIMIALGDESANINSSYIVEKQSGDVFRLDEDLKEDKKLYLKNNYFRNVRPVFSDDNGDIYYLGINSLLSAPSIYRINSPSSSPSISLLSPQDQGVENGFMVNKSGDLVYGAILEGSLVNRIIRSDSSIFDFQANNSMFWMDSDGDVYYIKMSMINYSTMKLDLNASPISESNFGGKLIDLNFKTEESYILRFQGKTIIVDAESRKLLSFYGENSLVMGLDHLFSSISSVVNSEEYYYIAGVDNLNHHVLKRCSADDYICKNFVAPNQYAIHKMSVSSDDKLTFNAFRLADSKRIIARKDTGGLTELDDTLLEDLLLFERISQP